jgi:hypothetical protein
MTKEILTREQIKALEIQKEKISKEIIEDYKFFFRKNKFVLSDKYLIIAFYNFNLIIRSLRLKNKFMSSINA